MKLKKTEIEIYRKSGLIKLHADKSYYENMDFTSAIKKAALAECYTGKMHPHQCWLGKKVCKKASDYIIKQNLNPSDFKDFNDIFELTESVKIKIERLGDLWSYDTALRIGFNLKIEPKDVFIQTGVIVGYKKLFNGKKPKSRAVSIDEFPIELRILEPYEIENFLCVWGSKKSKC